MSLMHLFIFFFHILQKKNSYRKEAVIELASNIPYHRSIVFFYSIDAAFIFNHMNKI